MDGNIATPKIAPNGKPGDWFWVIALRSGGVRVYCGLDATQDPRLLSCMRMEHIIPLCCDGPDVLENLALGCAGCNAMKGKWNPAADTIAPLTREQLIEKVRMYLEPRRAYYAAWVKSFSGAPDLACI